MPFVSDNEDLTAGVIRIEVIAPGDFTSDYESDTPFLAAVSGAATLRLQPWRDANAHTFSFTEAGAATFAGLAPVLCRAVIHTGTTLGSANLSIGHIRDA